MIIPLNWFCPEIANEKTIFSYVRLFCLPLFHTTGKSLQTTVKISKFWGIKIYGHKTNKAQSISVIQNYKILSFFTGQMEKGVVGKFWISGFKMKIFQYSKHPWPLKFGQIDLKLFEHFKPPSISYPSNNSPSKPF